MKQTPVYAIPYPEAGDHTRTWEYWQSMADRLETVLTAIDGKLAAIGKTGTYMAHLAGSVSGTWTVPYGKTFAGTPSVVVNIDSGSGTYLNLRGRALSPTPTQFTLFLFGLTTPVTVDVKVEWMALYLP